MAQLIICITWYYIPSTYLSYNQRFVPLTTFIQFPLLLPTPLPPLATILISLSKSFFVFEVWLTYNTLLVPGAQHSDLILLYISKLSSQYVQLPSVTIKSYYVIIDYILHTVHFTPMTHLFCNQKFVPFNLPQLFLLSPTPTRLLPSGNHLFVLCIYDCVSVLLCLSICFIFQILHINDNIQYQSFSDLFH